jgi:hypothetical protein
MSDWWSWRLRRRGDGGPDAPAPGDVTAQENYAVLVKDRLSPAFRELGLRGSCGRYELPLSVPGWALLGLQKSAYSDKAEIRFTLNLLVVSAATWSSAHEAKPYLPAKPSPGVRYGAGEQETRIGSIHPDDSGDKWWRVQAGPFPSGVAEDVIHDVAVVALPWLREQVSRL